MFGGYILIIDISSLLTRHLVTMWCSCLIPRMTSLPPYVSSHGVLSLGQKRINSGVSFFSSHCGEQNGVWCIVDMRPSCIKLRLRLDWCHFSNIIFTSMAWCKTAVTPVRLQRSYCSLALSHRHISGKTFLKPYPDTPLNNRPANVKHNDSKISGLCYTSRYMGRTSKSNEAICRLIWRSAVASLQHKVSDRPLRKILCHIANKCHLSIYVHFETWQKSSSRDVSTRSRADTYPLFCIWMS